MWVADAGSGRYAVRMHRLILLLPAAFWLSCLAAPASAGPPPAAVMVMPAVGLERVASGYGPRGDGFHPGIDLAAPYGSPVRAALGGRVVYAGRYFDYGNMVDIRSPDGRTTRYAHLATIAKDVRSGATVIKGATLGAIGTTGNAHGAHLHFEVRIHDEPVDPSRYLAFAAPAHETGREPEEVAEAPAPRAARRLSALHDKAGPAHHR